MKRPIRAAFAALIFSLPAGPGLAACSLNVIAELPVTMNGPRPIIQAKINGVAKPFVADSGAFFSVITPATAAELKLNVISTFGGLMLQGVGGETEASYTTVKTFTLAGAAIPNIQFVVTGGVGDDAAGLIGQNVLRVADVEYDLANGVIRLIEPKDCGDGALAYWASGMPYSIVNIERTDAQAPHTVGVITINGVKIRAIFDTGASTSALSLAAAARAGVKPGDDGVVAAGLTYGLGPYPVKTWLGRFASIDVGDEEIRNSKLRIGDIGLNGDMLLGADFFLSHRVFVSNSQHKLYFTYNGGPVFDTSAPTLAQDTPDQTPKASPPRDEGRDQPKDADGFSRRGAAFAARGDFDQAIADFSRASDLAPTQAAYVYQRALAHLENHQEALGAADLDLALKLAPDDIDALVARARLRLAKNDDAGAAADLESAGRIAPKDADVRLMLARLYEEADRLDPAIDQLDLWISSHAGVGQLATALNGRCWERALAGRDLDKALDDCNRALRDAPGTAAFLDSRGLVHLRMGDLPKAIADYDAALAIQPKLPWSLYGRGVAKTRQGLKTEGQADIAAAAAIDPTLPDKAKTYGIATQ